jgi:integrase
MSITLRPYRGGGWEVDITLPRPDGSRHRERKRVSQWSKSAARRWAEDRERYLLQHGPPTPAKEVPTLEQFAPRFLDGHPRANRHKPSGIVWADIDLGKRQLCVQRSEWRGHVTAPKGGRLRHVPLTARLATALREHCHLRARRVVCQPNGSPLSQWVVRDHVERCVRRAKLTVSGVHRLRHTFCSHLAMRGAPARAIQELAGHQDLATTQRYMHLSPAAIEGAIRLLDHSRPSTGGPHASPCGDMLDTASPATVSD